MTWSGGGLAMTLVVVTSPTPSNQSSSLVTVADSRVIGTEASKTCGGSTRASLGFISTGLVVDATSH